VSQNLLFKSIETSLSRIGYQELENH